MPPEVSLVIVSYKMNRQLKRTLLSLAPAHQRGVAARSCQVIVVDNGSPEPPDAVRTGVPGLEVEFHHIKDAPPSPVEAVNFGLSRARAPLVGVMIDGARMASPGLVASSVAASRLHPRAVIGTYNYHLGLEPQYRSVKTGYGEREEERLLASIGWPEDGYRLFEIAVLELGKGWPGALFETNALFMPRGMWDELGGYDPLFKSPGGGAVNHDTLKRACDLPGAQLIIVAGEATFHQVHGGIATNTAGEREHQRIAIEYMQIRKRKLQAVRLPRWLYHPRTGQIETV